MLIFNELNKFDVYSDKQTSFSKILKRQFVRPLHNDSNNYYYCFVPNIMLFSRQTFISR